MDKRFKREGKFWVYMVHRIQSGGKISRHKDALTFSSPEFDVAFHNKQ
jgi:hypothetical protein